MKKTSLRVLGISLVASALFVGCGGSSSSGGVKEGPSNNPTTEPTTDPTTEPAEPVMAAPTIENGVKVRNAVAGSNKGVVSGLNSVSSSSELNAGLEGVSLSKSLMKYVKVANVVPYSLNQTVDRVEDCAESGTIRYTGTFQGKEGGTMTVVADHCDEGDDYINGEYSVAYRDFDDEIKEFKYYEVEFITDIDQRNEWKRFSATSSAGSTMKVEVMDFDDEGYKENYKLTVTKESTDGVKKYKLKDCVYYIKEGLDYTEMYQTEGTVYIDNLESYVTYDTTYDMSKTPFIFREDDGVLFRGEARYNMSGNGKVKVVAADNETKYDVNVEEAKVYVDSDGDGVYELSE